MIKLLGFLSTPAYIFIGIVVLVYNADLWFINQHSYVAFFSFAGLLYLFLRAMLVQTINTKTEFSGLWFLLSAILPIIVWVVALIKSPDQGEFWQILFIYYVMVTIFDVVLLILQMLRIYRLTNVISTK